MPSTSDQPQWKGRQEALIASLADQPLLIVVRPDPSDLNGETGPGSLLDQLRALSQAGLRHVEIGWVPSPGWCSFVRRVQVAVPALRLGAASVISTSALRDLESCELPFGMSPCFDPALLAQAREMGILLVPGVFSPSEFSQAMAMDCRLVKLFPASSLGVDYVQRLRAPLGDLPLVIAAGGLAVEDLAPWLQAGHAAVALGRRVIGADGIAPSLLTWLGSAG